MLKSICCIANHTTPSSFGDVLFTIETFVGRQGPIRVPDPNVQAI